MPIIWHAVGACILPNTGGIAASIITRKEIKSWYTTLKLPSWTPPNYAFGPVWTILYTGMGYASYLVWKDGGGFNGHARLPLALYGSQLLLNWAWTPIFFGAHNIKLALIDLAALTVNAAACGYFFYQINKTAGLIFLPYLAWLSLATSLNYYIYKHNPKEIESTKKD